LRLFQSALTRYIYTLGTPCRGGVPKSCPKHVVNRLGTNQQLRKPDDPEYEIISPGSPKRSGRIYEPVRPSRCNNFVIRLQIRRSIYLYLVNSIMRFVLVLVLVPFHGIHDVLSKTKPKCTRRTNMTRKNLNMPKFHNNQ
jgi:hypothetical protein